MTTEADIRVPLNRDFSDNGEVPPRIAALFFSHWRQARGLLW